MLKRAVLGVGGASVAALTLMACYGGPPIDCESDDPTYGRSSAYCEEHAPDGGEDAGHRADGGVSSDAGEDADGGEDAGP